MISIFYLFLSIVVLFFVVLIVKSLLKKEFCAICVAVSLSWLSFFSLYKFNLFDNVIILALLMGQSILGVFYLLEKKSAESLKLFRLPFLLSLTFVFYSSVTSSLDFSVVKLLLSLWLLFSVIFVYRKNERIKLFVDKIVACCKWG